MLSPLDGGLVRACVEAGDGTSNLVLEGIQRVRFTATVASEPYRRCRLEPLGSRSTDAVEESMLCGQIKDLAGQRILADGRGGDEATIEALWESLGSDEAVADFVAFHLIPDVHLRQPLLAMEGVEERLAFVREALLQ